jgi:hypothetical protein
MERWRFAMKRFLIAFVCACALLAGTPLFAAKPVGGSSKWNQVAAMMQFMREEEKLARDVYLKLNEKYHEDTNTFELIALSEQSHTDAVKGLLDKYGVEDPAADTEPGEFVNEELQELYETLVEVGEEGLTAALNVGVTIEKKDMDDIADAIDLSRKYPDIVKVYSNLLAGSENHLAAFLAALEKADD